MHTSAKSAAPWRIILLLMGFAALGHLNRVGISVAGSEVFIKRMNISETQMGWVYTTFLIVYTIGMLPGGWFIDRFGAGKALTLLGLGMGTFAALTGSLTRFASSPETLWIGLLFVRGCAGAFNTPLHPGAAHVVSDLVPERRRATANGMVTAGALIGIACCYPVFGFLIDTVTWPWAFVICGMALFCYGVLWWSVVSTSLPYPESTPGNRRPAEGSRNDWALLLQPNIWLLTLSYAAFGYFQYLFFYWMNYYFESVLKVSDVASRQSSFCITLSQGAGMAIGGVSTDLICRLVGKSMGRRGIVMLGMGLAAVFGIVGINVTGQWNVTISLSISMAALGLCEGVFWTTATDIGGKSRGFSGAFMNTGGNIGGLISPVLSPFLAKRLDWNGVITVACVISALGGAVWLLISLPENPERQED